MAPGLLRGNNFGPSGSLEKGGAVQHPGGKTAIEKASQVGPQVS